MGVFRVELLIELHKDLGLSSLKGVLLCFQGEFPCSLLVPHDSNVINYTNQDTCGLKELKDNWESDLYHLGSI